MSKRKVGFSINEYYHVFNRGNSKQPIFLDEYDYQRFSLLLYVCNQNASMKDKLRNERNTDLYLVETKSPLVAIGAYCLMPNHFHLLITPTEDRGISIFMQRLSTAYSMYFNNKYRRVGSLFEGKFKSEYVDEDRYLKYLFSYIHLNPIKLMDKEWREHGIKNKNEAIRFLSNYKYSSFKDYLGLDRKEKVVVDKTKFPKYFPDPKSFVEELIIWLTYNDSQARPARE